MFFLGVVLVGLGKTRNFATLFPTVGARGTGNVGGIGKRHK